jgi:histone H3/H4
MSSPPPVTQDEDTTPKIPLQLLQRLLQEFLEDKKRTRISQPALNAMSEYTKTFVREAIYRATAERLGVKDPSDMEASRRKVGSVFVEVSSYLPLL